MSESDGFQRAVAFVLSSRYRSGVLDELADNPGTPKLLAERAGDMDIAHVSRALSELKAHDLVELTVPEDVRKGRIYAATERGERVLADVVEVQGDG